MFYSCWVVKSIRNSGKFGVESLESFWISNYLRKPRKFSDRGQKRGFRKPRKFLTNLESFWTSLFLEPNVHSYPFGVEWTPGSWFPVDNISFLDLSGVPFDEVFGGLASLKVSVSEYSEVGLDGFCRFFERFSMYKKTIFRAYQKSQPGDHFFCL